MTSPVSWSRLIISWEENSSHSEWKSEGVLDVKQVVHKEGTSKAGDSVLGQRGGMATVGALHDLSLWDLACQTLQAVLTEDVEALEQLGVCVGL